jgi:hypothetical protein
VSEARRSVIELVRELARILAGPDVSTESMVSRLGDRPVDLHGNVLVQEPRVSGVSQASVVRQVGTDRDEPALVTLDLESHIGLDELRAEFGAPRLVSPDHPGRPLSAVFSLGESDGAANVRLIADVRNDTVSRVTLTREAKLDSSSGMC